MVEWQLPKLLTRVRFPPGAPADKNTPSQEMAGGFLYPFSPTNALTLSFVADRKRRNRHLTHLPMHDARLILRPHDGA